MCGIVDGEVDEQEMIGQSQTRSRPQEHGRKVERAQGQRRAGDDRTVLGAVGEGADGAVGPLHLGVGVIVVCRANHKTRHAEQGAILLIKERNTSLVNLASW